MIPTLFITILVESLVVVGYCAWQKKPLISVLVTSLVGNIVTQSMLWAVLNVFFKHYVVALLVAEILIWATEGTALFRIRLNRLDVREALLLSLAMNVSSFGVGIFIPL